MESDQASFRKIKWRSRMNYIYFILMALASAWEELQQLVQRGSWNKDMFYSFLFWETDWNSFWSVFDSHHFAFGLFIVMAFMFVRQTYFKLINTFWTLVAHMAIYFIAFFWIRNIGMHILFRLPEFIQWKYLSPITF